MANIAQVGTGVLIVGAAAFVLAACSVDASGVVADLVDEAGVGETAAAPSDEGNEPGGIADQFGEPPFDSSTFDRYANIDDYQSEWPAYSDGYEFSDTPQSVSEQWILDEYAELWDTGVRAIAVIDMPAARGEEALPGVLVQYIDGERYEGNQDFPLGFRGTLLVDPDEYPTDTFHDAEVKWARGEDYTNGTYTTSFVGGYCVNLWENYDQTYSTSDINKETNTRIGVSKCDTAATYRTDDWFPDKEAAWAWLQVNGIPIGTGENARLLYPGEISMLSALTFEKNAHTNGVAVYDFSVDQWVQVVTYG